MRSSTLHIRITPEMNEVLKKRCEVVGVRVSEWVRGLIVSVLEGRSGVDNAALASGSCRAGSSEKGHTRGDDNRRTGATVDVGSIPTVPAKSLIKSPKEALQRIKEKKPTIDQPKKREFAGGAYQ